MSGRCHKPGRALRASHGQTLLSYHPREKGTIAVSPLSSDKTETRGGGGGG